MNGLQSHFNPEVGALVQLRKIFHNIIRQTVRPRSNGQADYSRLLQNNLVVFPQLLYRCVRIGISLKVTDILGVRPFQVLAVAHLVKLGDQIVAAAAGEIAGASGAAEGAAPLGD
ncbi:hypothetical protein D3C80_1498510 [compost metagenome]